MMYCHTDTLYNRSFPLPSTSTNMVPRNSSLGSITWCGIHWVDQLGKLLMYSFYLALRDPTMKPFRKLTPVSWHTILLQNDHLPWYAIHFGVHQELPSAVVVDQRYLLLGAGLVRCNCDALDGCTGLCGCKIGWNNKWVQERLVGHSHCRFFDQEHPASHKTTGREVFDQAYGIELGHRYPEQSTRFGISCLYKSNHGRCHCESTERGDRAHRVGVHLRSHFSIHYQAIIPAHLLRSVGGGYDNESVATTAMQLTFWTWTWTMSTTNMKTTAILGTISGFMYFYMVAAWGGYVFVINLVGLHAFFVFLLRKLPFDTLYTAYTSFYAVGTLLAMQVPVVGWTPLKSLEQLGPVGVFAGFQALQLMRVLERKFSRVNKWKVRAMVAIVGVVVSIPLLYYLYSSGYFGPISSRVRGLFVKHTKTGNPLVDSVAEHQAASAQAYMQYLR